MTHEQLEEALTLAAKRLRFPTCKSLVELRKALREVMSADTASTPDAETPSEPEQIDAVG